MRGRPKRSSSRQHKSVRGFFESQISRQKPCKFTCIQNHYKNRLKKMLQSGNCASLVDLSSHARASRNKDPAGGFTEKKVVLLGSRYIGRSEMHI